MKKMTGIQETYLSQSGSIHLSLIKYEQKKKCYQIIKAKLGEKKEINSKLEIKLIHNFNISSDFF
jgi:hypothetical protein